MTSKRSSDLERRLVELVRDPLVSTPPAGEVPWVDAAGCALLGCDEEGAA